MPSVTPEEIERRKQVAAVINSHLKEKNLRPSQLARQAGTPASAIFALVNQEKGLGPRLAEKLILAGVDENSLLEAVGFKTTADYQDKVTTRVARKLSQIPRRDLETIEEMVDSFKRRMQKEKQKDP